MNKTWSDEDVRRLIKFFPITTKDEICAFFPEKSYLAIYKKANSLRLRRKDEMRYINAKEGWKKRNFTRTPIIKHGYVAIYMPAHPRADASGRIFEHIAVWEEANGMDVPDGFVVHHINENKQDNRIENLMLMSRKEHITHHNLNRCVSLETKHKMSQKAKKRFSNKQNHPQYKRIDIYKMIQEISNGATVKSVCAEHGINKKTYYRKLKEYKII